MVATRANDIRGLIRANRAAAKLLRDLANRAKPGVRTGDLNDYAMAYLKNLGAEAVFNTEAGFPAAINTSVNDAVLHGVPGDEVLKVAESPQ